ncbi:MAG: tRNA uridine-5-carboxymethylaminomethyl(34) synthesis GTPase MnmE [Clostridia bacterium]|nr:tRNA uridine-5-carboxymethylaminomethyl(34) synthesis GTPase MnmE [Clostridia bacterium]
MEDTIFAPATPFGGAIAIVRISGGETRRIVRELFSRELTHGRMTHGALGLDEPLDDCMAVFFRAPASYTGEDMAEFYLHGSPAVGQACMELLSRCGARAAEPGEFTKRAFVNGKLKLAEAEAVMDLVQAKSQLSAREALLQLSGAVGRETADIEEALTVALAGVSAAMDYPDELEEDVFSALPQLLRECYDRLCALKEAGMRRRVLREGARVVIVGRPNAGKSSLLNALTGADLAIVTEVAGTTRDTIEEQTVMRGVPVRLVDTAGIRRSEDSVERLGVERAMREALRADVLLVAIDACRPWDEGYAELLELSPDAAKLAVLCKCDLERALDAADVTARTGLRCLCVSALTGEGLDELRRAVAELVTPAGSDVHITNMRHIEAVAAAAACLEGSWGQRDWDCVATDMREALRELARISGREVDASVIDAIFSRFCVGK